MKTKTKKIHILTLGCAKNTVDSEFLQRQLRANQFTISEEIDGSDLCIINTCGFIESAKQQSIDTILETVEKKKAGLIQNLFVMGCLSERYHEALKKDIPEVDKYFGSNNLPDILKELGAKYKYELLSERDLSTPSHYAYLKISEGCDNPCSFCAIPIMRGTHKSKPIDEIMKEVVNLSEKNIKELIVIGQDTTYYGLDLYGGRELPSLLKSLSTVNGIEWIRLMYAFPAKFPLEVLDVISDSEKICKYIDIPIQHASDSVLKSMRRGLTRKILSELLNKIRKKIPGIALRTTIITGYPNETEKDFEELITFLKEIEFDRLGVFTYSQEENTSAFGLGDPIPQKVKEERQSYIMDIQKEISYKRNVGRIGKTAKVLIERIENENYIGRTEWDAPEIDNEIIIPKNKHLKIGSFVNAKIVDSLEYDLFGEIVE